MPRADRTSSILLLTRFSITRTSILSVAQVSAYLTSIQKDTGRHVYGRQAMAQAFVGAQTHNKLASLVEREAVDRASMIDSLSSSLADEGWSKAVMVDLVRAYSKRQDLCDDLSRAVLRLRSQQAKSHQSTSHGRVSVRSVARSQPQRLADRFTDEDESKLIQGYRDGLTIRDLAAQFSIGTTSVKKLLREHGVSRKRQS